MVERAGGGVAHWRARGPRPWRRPLRERRFQDPGFAGSDHPRLSKPRPDSLRAYAALLDVLAEATQTFDIVHCHTDWPHFPLLNRLGVPHLTTFHNRLDTPDLPAVMARFPQAPLVSNSDHHRKPLPSANWLGTVYHGMPVEALAPSYEPGSYLAFVGRLTNLGKSKPPVSGSRTRSCRSPMRTRGTSASWSAPRCKGRRWTMAIA